MATDAEVFGGRKRMKLEPAILSVIGWHAKESVEEIVERKCNDIKRIGQTFWFFQSWKAPIPYVQRFGHSFPNPTVIFLKGGAYPTSANSEAREMSQDKKSWGPLPTGIGKVTGKIPGVGLVIGDLLPVQEEIDLWYFLDHTDLQPLRFQRGASTACAVPCKSGPIEGMKSRHRQIVAVGHLIPPYGLFLR
jgi:hypothetical protein